MKGNPRDTFWERIMYQAKNRGKTYLQVTNMGMLDIYEHGRD